MIEFPISVRDYADQTGVSQSTVRRAISSQHLEAETVAARPPAPSIMITGGDLPLRVDQFIGRVRPVCERVLHRGMYGFADNGDLHVLRGAERVLIPSGDRACYIRAVEHQLEELAREPVSLRDR